MKKNLREASSLLKYPNSTKIVLLESSKIRKSDNTFSEKLKSETKSVVFSDSGTSFNYSIGIQYKLKQGEVVW